MKHEIAFHSTVIRFHPSSLGKGGSMFLTQQESLTDGGLLPFNVFTLHEATRDRSGESDNVFCFIGAR